LLDIYLRRLQFCSLLRPRILLGNHPSSYYFGTRGSSRTTMLNSNLDTENLSNIGGPFDDRRNPRYARCIYALSVQLLYYQSANGSSHNGPLIALSAQDRVASSSVVTRQNSALSSGHTTKASPDTYTDPLTGKPLAATFSGCLPKTMGASTTKSECHRGLRKAGI
jgi:hypothetical protein